MTNNKSTLTLALGTVFVASMAASSLAVAAQNPFSMASLDRGYMVAAADMSKEAKAKEGKCGEGKCGASKADSTKMKDGNCGANKPATDKAKDGKCGEGKCGSTKK